MCALYSSTRQYLYSCTSKAVNSSMPTHTKQHTCRLEIEKTRGEDLAERDGGMSGVNDVRGRV
jgi:hypothetical protein